jgi:16S rRNA A1518/A1519 N6-dimethyltransferase RsmA/KsgA/DIM1 with predicted DNA glycosylase/AP lyase activity
MVLLVQREVAERMVAAPGSKQYGALSVNVQVAAIPEIIRHVPPGAFSPPPKVDSAVVRIVPRKDSLVTDEEAGIIRDAKETDRQCSSLGNSAVARRCSYNSRISGNRPAGST